MKSKILKLSTILLLFALVGAGCDKNDDDLNGKIKIKDFNYTGCKDESEKSAVAEQIQYKVTDGNYLSIEHVNAWFNCCPGELIAEAQLDSTTIILMEDEKESACDCICRYDLECKIGPLEYGEYSVILKRGTRIKSEFALLFNSSTDSTYIINN